jgi:hypothetical protein
MFELTVGWRIIGNLRQGELLEQRPLRRSSAKQNCLARNINM